MNFGTFGQELHDLQPRKAPRPSAFVAVSRAPLVPEVSLLLDEPIKIPTTDVFPATQLHSLSRQSKILVTETQNYSEQAWTSTKQAKTSEAYETWKQRKVLYNQSPQQSTILATNATSHVQNRIEPYLNSAKEIPSSNYSAYYSTQNQPPCEENHHSNYTNNVDFCSQTEVTRTQNKTDHVQHNTNQLDDLPQRMPLSNHHVNYKTLDPRPQETATKLESQTDSCRNQKLHNEAHSSVPGYTQPVATSRTAEKAGTKEVSLSLSPNVDLPRTSPVPATTSQLQNLLHASSSSPGQTKNKKPISSVQFEKLYNIIKLQNEQIQSIHCELEKMKHACRVDEKIQELEQRLSAVIAATNSNGNCERLHQTTQTSAIVEPQQVSVGIMTSFRFPSELPEMCPECPRCEREHKEEGDRRHSSLESNLSMLRSGHVRVDVQEESPVCSLHLDLRELAYDTESSNSAGSCSVAESDTASCECEASDEASPPGLNKTVAQQQQQPDQQEGWTFYDNALGQINQMLHSPLQPQTGTPAKLPTSTHNVRNATLQHLHQLGVNFTENENETVPKRVMFNSRQEQEVCFESGGDLSGRMNALALKHLTDQQLSTLATNAAGGAPGESAAAMMCSSDVTVYNNNMSFATMRYMQRYHILPSGSTQPQQATNVPLPTVMEPREQTAGHAQQPRTKMKHKHKKSHQDRALNRPLPAQFCSGTSKVLDITALKQQPKLL